MTRIVVAGLAASLSWSAAAEELPLKGVVLSTAGLAQFTHGGEVSPGGSVELSVRLDQVDDLLKSLTLFDEQGAIGAVSLPGKAPLAELFRDLPFDQEALKSRTALLNAMAGSTVEIDGPLKARGRLLPIEEETIQLPNEGGQKIQHRITLITDDGLVQAVLEDLTALRFADSAARTQIERALSGLAQNRAKERRTLSIGFLGRNRRQAGFTYVVAAPIWKTAYRLVLPPEEGAENGKARLQGWSVVENLTGSDWTDVDLSLISGNPVALKQALYTAFYVDRPEAPVEAATRLTPRKDDVDEADSAGDSIVLGQRSFALAAPRGGGGGGGAGGFAGRGGPEAELLERNRAAAQEAESKQAQAAPIPFGGAALAAQAEEAASQVSFRFPAKITLAAGSTMMTPFVDREIAADRTWLYQPETNARHPLAAARLTNDGETALPAGLITAFEADGGATLFVGDARAPLMPRGDTKFIAFALDSKTAIRRNDRGQKQSVVGTAANGVMTKRTQSRWTIDYEITPSPGEAREVVIDEARPSGWSVASDMSGVDQTAARLRYKVGAPAGTTTKATLRLEKVEERAVTLTTLEPDDLLVTLRGLENESPSLKQTLAALAALTADVNRIETRRAELEAEEAKIGEDQGRIRENLKAVGQGSDLGRRYLGALNAQEDRLAAIAREGGRLDQDLAAKRREAEGLAQRLSL